MRIPDNKFSFSFIQNVIFQSNAQILDLIPFYWIPYLL